MADAPINHHITPSSSFESSNPDQQDEASRPQSVWSDSDHSDSQAKRWVAKGSKMLKKQNSRFNLSSSRIVDWVEEDDEPIGQDNGALSRVHGKHSRMWSTGTDFQRRPNISEPFNFRHLTHTQPRQFPGVQSASQSQLITEFSAVRASQSPRRELQGIRAQDLQPSRSDSALSTYHGQITPPALSPTKSRFSRPNSSLSIKNPGYVHHARSIDNFSQPSPRTYRLPPSPNSPPIRTSSRYATSTAPDFFSDQHHATPEEREFLTPYNSSADTPAYNLVHTEAATTSPSYPAYDAQDVPHALTTPDDVAFPLKPPMLRRSTLALADVPEEDELHSVKRASTESSRPKTADANLRHAKSFPTNSRSSHRKKPSLSRKSIGRPDSALIEGSVFNDTYDSNTEALERPSCDSVRPRMSSDTKRSDNGWEDTIDYCYQQAAEANCDFDWDCVSKHHPSADNGKQGLAETDGSREDGNPTPQPSEKITHNTSTETYSHHLARLQTSLPALDFSAASSAKSSMASLRGPITPLHTMPSPRRSKPSLSSWNSTDTLNLDSSFYIPQDNDGTWSQQDDFQKVPSWPQSSNLNHSLSHLSLTSNNSDTASRHSRPHPNKYHSSESVVPSRTSSAAQTRRNTSSGGSLPELVCSKNYRQYAKATAEQISDRIAVLSASNNNVVDVPGPYRHLERPAILTKTMAPPPAFDANVSVGAAAMPDQDDVEVPAPLRYNRSQDQPASVASFAQRLRSSSIASSNSGSSRMSRVSYSLFPSVPATRT
ncbi:MAG: hypothetical protein Q9174_002197 [Haloplaca sp. 1 TL-2023]